MRRGIFKADTVKKDGGGGFQFGILLIESGKYGKDILQKREYADRAGKTVTAVRIDERTAQDIYIAALHDLGRLSAAIELIDFSHTQSEVEGIVKNTVYLGMPAELRLVLAISESK